MAFAGTVTKANLTPGVREYTFASFDADAEDSSAVKTPDLWADTEPTSEDETVVGHVPPVFRFSWFAKRTGTTDTVSIKLWGKRHGSANWEELDEITDVSNSNESIPVTVPKRDYTSAADEHVQPYRHLKVTVPTLGAANTNMNVYVTAFNEPSR